MDNNVLSLLNKRWVLRSPIADMVDEVARFADVSKVVARLLINRKIEVVDEVQMFMESTLSSLHDPFLITGMKSAADRILRAIENRESIRLFCDYDVDGVTSAAFLTHFFNDIGVTVRHYLPERLKEGYGLNEAAIKIIKEEGDSLLITADCGITAVKEVALAQALKLDVIITDHHQVGSEGLPKALAVLNPHCSNCTYPYQFLSGVGLAFKLAVAVRNLLHKNLGWEKKRLPNMKRHLDLVALGTIADVAPLTGENHVLVRHGLEVLTRTDKPGLVALKAVAGIDNQVNSRSVGFSLGPRLNAAGRLGKADIGFHLLISDDLKKAKDLAQKLDAINQERKNIQEQVQDEVDYLIGREIDLEKDRVIVLASENFHSGVVGIVASRIVEKYFRPVVLIALENGVGKGSGRSIPQFNLHRAFTESANHLIQYGGHAYAAGLTIDEGNVYSFRNEMNAIGQRVLSANYLIPELILDTPLKISEVNEVLHEQIARMEPFGAENSSPLFLFECVRIAKLKTIGREKSHVRFQAIQGDSRIDAIGFNLAKEFACIDEKFDNVDLACELLINDWNGRKQLELKVTDFKVSTPRE